MDRIDTYCNVHVLLHIVMYSPLLSLSPLSLSLSLSTGLCWFPGPVGFDWYIHAWEGTHTQDIISTNIQGSLVAEDTSAHHWKKIWTMASTFSSEDYHFNMDGRRMGGQAPLTYEGYQEL